MALVEGLVGEAQTCAIPTRLMHDNFNLMQYNIKRVGCKTGFRGDLISLDQSKAFDRVDHRYLVVVLKADGFGTNFRSWNAAMQISIYSVVGTILDLLNRTSGVLSLLEPERERAVSAYADNISAMASITSGVEVVGTSLEQYEKLTRAKCYKEKSLGLQLGTKRVKTMLSNRHWMQEPVKLLVI